MLMPHSAGSPVDVDSSGVVSLLPVVASLSVPGAVGLVLVGLVLVVLVMLVVLVVLVGPPVLDVEPSSTVPAPSSPQPVIATPSANTRTMKLPNRSNATSITRA